MSLLKLLNAMRGGAMPWWLGNGAVPKSNSYTIYDPLVALSLSESYINLANPGTRNAAPGIAPGFSLVSGWSFNGINQYLNTNQPPGNESTVIIWVEEATGVYIVGATGTGGRQYFLRPVNSNVARYTRETTNVNVPTDIWGNVMAMTKNSGYRTGIPEATMVSLSGAITFPLFIGAQNNLGSPVNYAGGKVYRFAYYDFTLTNDQVEAVVMAMLNYNLGTLNAYAALVLSLSPVLYYPLNEGIGHAVLDNSGNKRHGEAYYYTSLGNAGPYGNSARGAAFDYVYIHPNNKFITDGSLSMNEFSFSCLIYIDDSASNNQVRVFNAYTASGDYYACEIRSRNQCSSFLRQQASNQNNAAVTTPLNQWFHLVCWHSLSDLTFGFDINGTRHSFTLTLAGYTENIASPYPYFGQRMLGNIQHCALFNKKLSLAESQSLNPF